MLFNSVNLFARDK